MLFSKGLQKTQIPSYGTEGAAFFQEAINLGQKRKLDFKKYPEVLRYAEVTRLTMLINSAEGREQELSRFQEMLLHDLDAGR